MISEDVEFQISQYVDGTLPAPERKLVDELLQSDRGAQKVLADYQRLNGYLRSLGNGPVVRWDQFADQISHAIDQANEPPAVAGRIGFFTARWRIAAAVLLAGSALIVAKHAMRSKPVVPQITTPSSLIDVQGPAAEVATGKPSEEISVGPSPALAARNSRYGEGVIGQGPSKVVIIGEVPKPPVDSHLH
jgi:anti-sigma factor RsiW